MSTGASRPVHRCVFIAVRASPLSSIGHVVVDVIVKVLLQWRFNQEASSRGGKNLYFPAALRPKKQRRNFRSLTLVLSDLLLFRLQAPLP
jgi:hypothetical protein